MRNMLQKKIKHMLCYNISLGALMVGAKVTHYVFFRDVYVVIPLLHNMNALGLGDSGVAN